MRISQDDPEEIPTVDLLAKSNGEGGPVIMEQEEPSTCCDRRCGPLLSKYNPLPPNPSLFARLKYALLCPPHGKLADLITYIIASLTVWGAAYCMIGKIALPGEEVIPLQIKGGTVFALLVLTVASWVGGWVAQLLRQPPLLGMLVVGIMLKNIPGIAVARGLDPTWSAATRSIALAVILLRAGLGLDPQALKKLSGMVFRLAFTPCLAETLVVAIMTNLLLGLPWLWGIMLGFVLGAVTPAVIVPCMLSLQENNWGVSKGIPTLVIAAASVDDVLAISCFTILLGVTFNANAVLWKVILQGPLEAVVGLVWGVVWGALVIFFPPQPQPNNQLRILLLVGGSLLALFGSDAVALPGSGALAVLVMAFTAGLGWRGQGWGDDNPVTDCLEGLWFIFEPLLFSLIGTEIQVTALDPVTVGWGVLVLACSLTFRMIISYTTVLGGQLIHRERLFVALAWLPKATVQAAIGPIALDKAKQALATAYPTADCSMLKDVMPSMDMVNGTIASVAGGEDMELQNLCNMVEWGGIILTIAVLGILITAPVGAIAIMATGPKLLSNDDAEKSPEEKA